MTHTSRFRSISRFAWMLAAAGLLFAFAGLRVGLSAAQNTQTHSGPVIDDWSHHRLMFSDPGTLADAANHGTIEKWLKVTNDPRFRLQQTKQRAAAAGRNEFRGEGNRDRERDDRFEFDRENRDPGQNPFANTPSDRLPRGIARVNRDELGSRGGPRSRGRSKVRALGSLQTD